MDPHPFEREAAAAVSVSQTAVVQQHLASFEDTGLLFLQTFDNEKMRVFSTGSVLQYGLCRRYSHRSW